MKTYSLLNKFISNFKINKYTYETNLPIEKLREKIELVINQKEFINLKYNLTGSLNSDDTFKLSRRIGLIVINNGSGGPPVTITGKLIAEGRFKTNIEILLKPNLFLIILPILFGILAIIFIAFFVITHDKNYAIGGLSLIAIPVFWAMINYSKWYYKTEFEKALGLTNSNAIHQK